jgi:hypothetical protein
MDLGPSLSCRWHGSTPVEGLCEQLVAFCEKLVSGAAWVKLPPALTVAA